MAVATTAAGMKVRRKKMSRRRVEDVGRAPVELVREDAGDAEVPVAQEEARDLLLAQVVVAVVGALGAAVVGRREARARGHLVA